MTTNGVTMGYNRPIIVAPFFQERKVPWQKKMQDK